MAFGLISLLRTNDKNKKIRKDSKNNSGEIKGNIKTSQHVYCESDGTKLKANMNMKRIL